MLLAFVFLGKQATAAIHTDSSPLLEVACLLASASAPCLEDCFEAAYDQTLPLASGIQSVDFHLADSNFMATSKTMELLERITVEAGKCGGRPCIRGYRLRVSDVLDLIASGASNDEILADYPFLEAEDIVAALTYAARQTDHAVIAGAA